MLRKLSLVALLLGAGVQAHELRRPDEQAIATAYDVVEAGEEVEFTAARDDLDDDECPEGEDMIRGIGCRGNPQGDRPICDDGRPARRACYRENTSWWQCEEDCYLGPPESEQGQENRRRPPPDDTTSSDYSVYTAARDECPEGEDMIPGIGCRGDPEGPKPRCGNGQTAHRACYRENSSWWQCEKDCYLGPPRSKQGRINRREKRREEREPPVDDKAIDAGSSDRTCKHYWLTITCRGDDTSSTETSETDMTSSQEVRDANVCDECLQGDGTHCSWNWKAEGCTNGGGGNNNRNTRRPTNRPTPRPNNGGNNKSSIQCTKPNPKRIQKEGQQAVCDSLETSPPRDVMYQCQDGSKLCCTESDMRRVNFKNKDWGQCRIKRGSEIVSEA